LESYKEKAFEETDELCEAWAKLEDVARYLDTEYRYKEKEFGLEWR